MIKARILKIIGILFALGHIFIGGFAIFLGYIFYPRPSDLISRSYTDVGILFLGGGLLIVASIYYLFQQNLRNTLILPSILLFTLIILLILSDEAHVLPIA